MYGRENVGALRYPCAVFVDGPSCRLWVEIAGEGAPVTVVAHGLTSSSADLTPFADGIGGTVVRLDFRGHGRSESPPASAGYDVAAMAADVNAVARATGAARAVGVSMGASAVLRLIAVEPARFEAAALIIPPQIDEPMPGVDAYAYLAERILREPRQRVVDDMMAEPAVRAIVERCAAWEPRLRGLGARMNADGMVHALRSAPGGAPPVPDPSVLRHVEIPVLVAGHERDPSHEASVCRRLGALLPNARVEIAARPLAMLDDMRSFGARVDAFLARAEVVA